MPNMSDATLLAELDKLTHDATGNNSTFTRENEELLERYNGELYGDELAGQSKVVSNDVMDVVEADMPSLARIFLGKTPVFEFKPNSQKEDDVKEAEEKTKYVNWQIRSQPWSFPVLFGFLKNAEVQKLSVVKYFIEETTEVQEHKKTGLSNDELAIFEESLEGEDVESVEVDREEETDSGDNDVVFKVKKTVKRVKIIDVPLETFRMTKNASSKETAGVVGDETLMTRGDLLSLGFKREQISRIQTAGDHHQSAGEASENSRLPDIRDKAEGGTEGKGMSEEWASEEVLISDLYPLIDYDGDGIAERRHIMRGGEEILINEVFNHVPYAMMSAILMPHKVIGKSRAEITAPTARAKTAILRGVNNNIYAVNNPRIAANESVNMDDLLVMRLNGVLRTSGKEPVANSMMPVTVPYIGDKALQVIQYWDQARAQTTGSLMASQGLEADALEKETATRFEGIKDDSQSKVELVARVYAETGFRQLYEGVAWLDANFQNSELEIEILGNELSINPGDWKFDHHVTSKVGLGAGDDENMLQTMTGLWTIHQELQAAGSPMTDEVKRFNIAKSITNASGLSDVGEFFNNPEKPEELITAQNEILTNIVNQLQEQLQNLQNPLAEAETIKAQADLVKAQATQQLNIAKLAEDQRQFNTDLAAEMKRHNDDIALQLTKLRADNE
jgi:hypothetical protein